MRQLVIRETVSLTFPANLHASSNIPVATTPRSFLPELKEPSLSLYRVVHRLEHPRKSRKAHEVPQDRSNQIRLLGPLECSSRNRYHIDHLQPSKVKQAMSPYLA